MNPATDQLPRIAAIFRGIKAGRHWCFGDPEYSDLNGELFDRYKEFFAQLELNLHRDPRGFVYGTSDDDDYKGSDTITRFVVFTAVWVDVIADRGDDLGKALFAPNQTISSLPHLGADAHRRVLKEVGIETQDDLVNTLRSLERLGFTDIDSLDRFTLRPAFHRLLDVCLHSATATPPPVVDSAAVGGPEPGLANNAAT